MPALQQLDLRWAGKPNDPTFNNANALANMMDVAHGRTIVIPPGTWYFAPTTAVLPNSLSGNSCIYPPSNTTLQGVPGQTIIKCMTFGLQDPTTHWEIWAPSATPLLRNTFYGGASLAYLNGHTYRAAVGGLTGGAVPAGLTGIFPGVVVDNAVSWEVADRVWRGRGISLDQRQNVTLQGLTIDMSGPREDAAYPITTTIPGLMQGSYTDIIGGSGWDSSHQCVWGNSSVENLQVLYCTLKSCRGELAYIGGGNPGRVLFSHCSVTDGNADGISSTAAVRVEYCHIWHVSQAVECFAGTFSQDYSHNTVYDVFHGFIVGASAPVTNPGRTSITHNLVTSYSAGIRCISTVAPIVFENFDFSHNGLVDCRSWSILLQGFTGGSIANGVVAHNQMICDQQSCNVGIEVSSDGPTSNVIIDHNEQIRTPSAITAGRDFGDGIRTSIVDATSTGVRYLYNTLRGRVNTGGSVSATTYSGLWLGNIYGADASGDLEGIGAAGTVHPHNERIYILSSLGANTIATAATVGNVTKMETGQLVYLIGFDDGAPVLFPITGATHAFPAPRITKSTVDFQIRLNSNGLWDLAKYVLRSSGAEPIANDVAPAFQTINSECPNIQMWGLLKTVLSNAGATNVSAVLNPQRDKIFTVQHGANETFLHNAGAGVIKLKMTGAVNYVPGAAGEVLFKVSSGGTFANEIARVLY